MTRSRTFVRDFEATDVLELFIVAAVATILAVRLFLHLAGYPTIGGASLHLAHNLWGGLLMLAGFVILLSFLGRPALRLGAVVGGVGFGLFIDEVGKSVTRDVDYFFQPAVALMYVTFIAVFLLAHLIHGRRERTGQEYLLNALREMEELALHDLDRDEAARARRYLARSDPEHPLVPALERAMAGVGELPEPRLGRLGRARRRARRLYDALTRHPWYDRTVVLVFVGQLVVKLVAGAVLVVGVEAVARAFDPGPVALALEALSDLSTAETAQLAASGLAGLFVLLGVVRILAGQRLAGYRMFERALLVSILLVQVFSFYSRQFAALVELAVNLLLLVSIRSMIRLERADAAI